MCINTLIAIYYTLILALIVSSLVLEDVIGQTLIYIMSLAIVVINGLLQSDLFAYNPNVVVQGSLNQDLIRAFKAGFEDAKAGILTRDIYLDCKWNKDYRTFSYTLGNIYGVVEVIFNIASNFEKDAKQELDAIASYTVTQVIKLGKTNGYAPWGKLLDEYFKTSYPPGYYGMLVNKLCSVHRSRYNLFQWISRKTMYLPSQVIWYIEDGSKTVVNFREHLTEIQDYFQNAMYENYWVNNYTEKIVTSNTLIVQAAHIHFDKALSILEIRSMLNPDGIVGERKKEEVTRNDYLDKIVQMILIIIVITMFYRIEYTTLISAANLNYAMVWSIFFGGYLFLCNLKGNSDDLFMRRVLKMALLMALIKPMFTVVAHLLVGSIAVVVLLLFVCIGRCPVCGKHALAFHFCTRVSTECPTNRKFISFNTNELCLSGSILATVFHTEWSEFRRVGPFADGVTDEVIRSFTRYLLSSGKGYKIPDEDVTLNWSIMFCRLNQLNLQVTYIDEGVTEFYTYPGAAKTLKINLVYNALDNVYHCLFDPSDVTFSVDQVRGQKKSNKKQLSKDAVPKAKVVDKKVEGVNLAKSSQRPTKKQPPNPVQNNSSPKQIANAVKRTVVSVVSKLVKSEGPQKNDEPQRKLSDVKPKVNENSGGSVDALKAKLLQDLSRCLKVPVLRRLNHTVCMRKHFNLANVEDFNRCLRHGREIQLWNEVKFRQRKTMYNKANTISTQADDLPSMGTFESQTDSIVASNEKEVVEPEVDPDTKTAIIFIYSYPRMLLELTVNLLQGKIMFLPLVRMLEVVVEFTERCLHIIGGRLKKITRLCPYTYSIKYGSEGIVVQYSEKLALEIKKWFYGGLAVVEAKTKIYLASHKDQADLFRGSWLYAIAVYSDEDDQLDMNPQGFLNKMKETVEMMTGKIQNADGHYPSVKGVPRIQKFNRFCSACTQADPMQKVGIEINPSCRTDCFTHRVVNYCLGEKVYQIFDKLYPANCVHGSIAAVSNRLYKYFGDDVNNPKFDWKQWGDDFIVRVDKFTDYDHYVEGEQDLTSILAKHGGKKGEAYQRAVESTTFPKFAKLILKNEPVKMKDYFGATIPDKPRGIISSGKFLTVIFHHICNHLETQFLSNGFCAKGLNNMDKANLLCAKAGQYKYYFCTDGTRFDAHVNRYLVKFERYVIDQWCNRYNMSFNWKLFERKILGNDDLSIRMPLGGRKSGDPWTSFFNCLINCSVGLYFKEKDGIDFLNDGDDMVWFSNDPELYKEIISFYAKLGIETRVEEICTELTEIQFCQCKPYQSASGWILVRSPMKTLQGLVYWREKPYSEQWYCLMCAKLICTLQQYPSHPSIRNIAIHFLSLYGLKLKKYLAKRNITEIDLLMSRGIEVNPTIERSGFVPEVGDWIFELWGIDVEQYFSVLEEFEYILFHKCAFTEAREQTWDYPVGDFTVEDLVQKIIVEGDLNYKSDYVHEFK